jgi:cytochrome c553
MQYKPLLFVATMVILGASAPILADPSKAAQETKVCLIAGWENPPSVCKSHTRTIASTCFICHGPNGKSNGAIPSLAGQDKDYLVSVMKEYRDGKRDDSVTVMKKYAVGYTEQEYEDMAAFFAAIK